MKRLLLGSSIVAWFGLGWMMAVLPNKPLCMDSLVVQKIDISVAGKKHREVGSCDGARLFEPNTAIPTAVRNWIDQIQRVDAFLAAYHGPRPFDRVQIFVEFDSHFGFQTMKLLSRQNRIEVQSLPTDRIFTKLIMEAWAKESFGLSWKPAGAIREMATDFLTGAASGDWLPAHLEETPKSHVGVCEELERPLDQQYFCGRLTKLTNDEIPIPFHAISAQSLRPIVGRHLRELYLSMSLQERQDFLRQWMALVPYLNVTQIEKATASSYRNWWSLGGDFLKVLSLRKVSGLGADPAVNRLVIRDSAPSFSLKTQMLKKTERRSEVASSQLWNITRRGRWDFFREATRPVLELEPSALPVNQTVIAKCQIPTVGEILKTYQFSKRVLFVEDCPRTSVHANLDDSLDAIRQKISPRSAGSVVQFYLPSLKVAVQQGLNPNLPIVDVLKTRQMEFRIVKLLGLQGVKFYEWMNLDAPLGAIEFFKLAPQAFRSTLL